MLKTVFIINMSICILCICLCFPKFMSLFGMVYGVN